MENHRRFPSLTLSEIHQQPETWPATLAIVEKHPATARLKAFRDGAVISGAGSSAYAAGAVAEAWRSARAIPTTDLVTEDLGSFSGTRIMLSLARSGNSPESVAAVERMLKFQPLVEHFAITCNAEGRLAQQPGVTAIALDPRTNDQGLAMTSSFSNLVLAGLCMSHGAELSGALPALCGLVADSLPALSEHAESFAKIMRQRVIVLASSPLLFCAREAALKILELTAGRIAVLTETFLGLRHGPMSFLDRDTAILAFVSSDPKTRRYEIDVLAELRSKKLGISLGILPSSCDQTVVDDAIPAMAENLPDYLRTPFEIVYGQLLAYHLSRRVGLDPDHPSPSGVISRVVQGVTIYAD